jgi:hypothetical protein
MTVFLVSTYIVKPEKLAQHTMWGKNLVASMKQNPDQFKEVKSLKVCHQKSKDTPGKYVALWEFKNAADRKAWKKRFHKKQIVLSKDFAELLVPETFTTQMWKPIKSMRRVSKHPT